MLINQFKLNVMSESKNNKKKLVLFKNKKHVKGGNLPVYTGIFEDEKGNKHNAAAWLASSSKGQTYLSCSISSETQEEERAKYAKESNKAQKVKAQAVQNEENEDTEPEDDLPF